MFVSLSMMIIIGNRIIGVELDLYLTLFLDGNILEMY